MILYKFAADWCGPCKVYGPIVQKVAEELNLTVTNINVDEPDNAALIQEYKIRTIPYLVFKDSSGNVHSIIGSKTEEELKNTLSKLLS